MVSVVAMGVVVTLAGCLHCSDNVNGVHKGDTLRLTVGALYVGDGGRDAFPRGLPPCGTLNPLSGASLTLTARLDGPAEDCADHVLLTVQSSNLPNLTPAPSPSESSILRVSDGCSGYFNVTFEPLTPNASVYDDVPDGGSPSWILSRSFGSTPDSATCPDAGVGPGFGCGDGFVAHVQR